MIRNTFADLLGSHFNEASSNMLLHALDFAFTGSSGVPPAAITSTDRTRTR